MNKLKRKKTKHKRKKNILNTRSKQKYRVKNKAKGKSLTIKKKTTTSNSIPKKTNFNFNFKSNKRNKKCYNNRTHVICAICFEKLVMPRSQKPKQIVELKCGHCFHKNCIKKWNKNCPFCRKKIVFKNEDDEYDEDDEDDEDNEDDEDGEDDEDIDYRNHQFVRRNLITLITNVFSDLVDAGAWLADPSFPIRQRDREEFIKFFRINLLDLNTFNNYTTEEDNFGKFNDLKNYLLDTNNSVTIDNYIETGNVNDTAKF